MNKNCDIQFSFSFDENITDQITFIQSNDEHYIIFAKNVGLSVVGQRIL